MRGDDPRQALVDTAVARHQNGRAQDIRAFQMVGDAASRLLEDQDPGGHVPWRQGELPIAVESAASHPTDVEGGRADPSQPLCFLQDSRHDSHVCIGLLLAVVGEPGGDQPVAHLLTGRHVDRVAVEGGAASPGGGELLPPADVHDHTGHRLAVLPHRDRDGYLGEPVDEVHGPVERIHDPHTVRVPTGTARLFSQDLIVGSEFSEHGEYRFLSLLVDDGDRIHRSLQLDLRSGGEASAHDLGAGAGSSECDIEVGSHAATLRDRPVPDSGPYRPDCGSACRMSWPSSAPAWRCSPFPRSTSGRWPSSARLCGWRACPASNGLGMAWLSPRRTAWSSTSP